MPGDLAGKVALVAGAGSGIGEAAALALAEAGVAVAVSGRRSDKLESLVERIPGWLFASYSTSKFGLTGFTESLRQECGRQGIRVAIVEPGSTATEIASSIADPKISQFIHQRVTGEGAMGAEDIADAIMLIVSLPRRANVTRILVQPTVDVDPMP